MFGEVYHPRLCYALQRHEHHEGIHYIGSVWQGGQTATELALPYSILYSSTLPIASPGHRRDHLVYFHVGSILPSCWSWLLSSALGEAAGVNCARTLQRHEHHECIHYIGRVGVGERSNSNRASCAILNSLSYLTHCLSWPQRRSPSVLSRREHLALELKKVVFSE